MSELDDFVADSTAEVEETPVEAQETPVEAPEAPVEETETPEEPPQEEAPEGSTAEPETPKTDKEVPLTALLDERDKRQQYQAQVEELKRQLEEATKTPEVMPDVLEDQEGFVAQLESKLIQATKQNRIELSQEMMRITHEDYDAVEGKFVEMAADNHDLARQMAEARNPAKFAYDTVKKAEKLEQLENVDELEAKMRAELEEKVRAELKAEYQGQLEDLQAKAGALSPSIAGERAAGGNAPVLDVDDPLETTFNR